MQRVRTYNTLHNLTFNTGSCCCVQKETKKNKMRKCHSIVTLKWSITKKSYCNRQYDEDSQIMQQQQTTIKTHQKPSVKILISCNNLSCISLHHPYASAKNILVHKMQIRIPYTYQTKPYRTAHPFNNRVNRNMTTTKAATNHHGHGIMDRHKTTTNHITFEKPKHKQNTWAWK